MGNRDEPVLYDGRLYDYTAGTNCGVLVTKEIMRKLAKLQTEHLRQVKMLLLEGAEEEKVFPSMWTLHYPDGKQTRVKFIDTSADVLRRINMATHARQPIKEERVFIAASMEEAEGMADALLKALEEQQDE